VAKTSELVILLKFGEVHVQMEPKFFLAISFFHKDKPNTTYNVAT